MKQKNAVILAVDFKAAPPGIGAQYLGGVFTKHPIYIGGHPHLDSGKPLRGSVSRAQYVGCIKNIVIRDQSFPLDPSRVHGLVLADVCPTI